MASYTDLYSKQNTAYTDEYITPLTTKTTYYENKVIGTSYFGSSYMGGITFIEVV